MKKLFFVTQIIASFLLIISCSTQPTADQVQVQQQEKILQEGTRELGMPAIKNFQEKKTLKWIYELRDDAKILNYAYCFSEVTGKFSYIGKCIGFPIPYCTQYTTPQRPAHAFETHEQGNIVIPNADPNGLFSPSSADGTWILLVNPKTGEPKPMYMEPKVTVVPFPLPDNICTINVKQ
jgi:hypothetical protein